MRSLRRYLADPYHLTMSLLALVPVAFVIVMVTQNRFNHPIFDNEIRAAPLAIATATDGANPALIFRAYDGQLSVMYNLVNIAFTLLTRWNIGLEVYTGIVLAGFTLIGGIVLLASISPRLLPIGAVVVSALIFSPHQNANWFVSYVSNWQFTFAFFMWGMVALVRLRERRWLALLVAGLAALLATFSFGNGVVTWGGLGVTLLTFGYGKPRYWVVWGMMAAAALALYVMVAGIGVGTTEGVGRADVSISLETLPTILFFAVNLVANQFVIGQPTVALIVTAIALIWAITNTALLIWRWQDWQTLGVWGAWMAYGLIVIMLVAAARYADYPDRELAAFYAWYRTATLPFWLGAGMIALTVIWRLSQETQRGRVGGVLLSLNLILTMTGGFLYAYSNAVNEAHPLGDSGYRFKEEWGIYDPCYVRYIFTQNWWTQPDDPCGGAIDNAMMSFDKSLLGSEISNELAAHRLALYADLPLLSVVPLDRVDESLVVLDEPQAWSQVHMRTFLLDGYPPAQILHALNPNIGLNNPLDLDMAFSQIYDLTTNPDRALSNAIDTAQPQVVYVIRREDAPTTLPGFRDWLERNGYAAAPETATVAPVTFAVMRYERPPITPDEPIRFGDDVQLVGWGFASPPNACERVTLRTYWTATDTPPTAPYSLTVRTNDTATDAGLGRVPSHVWEADKTYMDEREITLPCDNSPLQLGVYDPTDGALFPTSTGGELLTLPPN